MVFHIIKVLEPFAHQTRMAAGIEHTEECNIIRLYPLLLHLLE
uniref:Uncharacterized protein n=1 Tax=Arundo donax TaxID=35708 RepID=A0A0A8Y147_ARUDO